VEFPTQDSLHLANVVEAYENMKRAEQERDDWRVEFLSRLRNARDAGVTVAQVSRATGVSSPNVFRMLRN
jgi:DNA-binding phage protein